MGTNRRSRRRSAARILNSTSNSKRTRLSPGDSTDADSFENPYPSEDDTPPQSPSRQIQLDITGTHSVLDDTGTTLSPTTNIVRNNNISPIVVGNSISHQDPHPTFTTAHRCSYELMTLLDNAGCALNTYGRLVTLLKEHEKLGFSYSQACSRDKLLTDLRKKFHCPTLQTSVINNCDIFSFPFVDMLQDLVDTAGTALHIITPTGSDDILKDELWNTEWMQQTFQSPSHIQFDPKTDIMLPIILFVDKTGTDVLQRYSLEPLLFTVAALSRESRENRRFWRHLGFIPSSKTIEDSRESLEFYHKCLGYILTGLKQAQQTKPLIKVKKSDGSYSSYHAHLPLMIIMGDQLSQDTLCCRKKSNSGGAGRVHRSCMCSYLDTDNHKSKCKPLPKDTIHDMIIRSTRTVEDMEAIIDMEELIDNKRSAKTLNSKTMKYLRRQRQMFNTILGRPFTMHPVISAFHDVDFGAWKNGVYDATFDDFMHSCEEGMMENIGGTLFGGLVPSECEKVESLMIPFLTFRSSAKSTFPRWRISKGFSRQTLMTMAERVGSVFSIALALHIPSIAQLFNGGHERQRTKYQTFHKDAPKEVCKMYYAQHMHTMTPEACRHTLTHLYRHGFDITLIETLDTFQINQLMYATSSIFEKTSYPDSYPSVPSIEGVYSDKGKTPRISQHLINKVVTAMDDPASKQLLEPHRLIPVERVIPKHHLSKPKQKGDGSTCAFLGTNPFSMIMFLEYTLCYHSFCKYSSSLPPNMRRNHDLIDFGGRSLLTYFSKMIYRGDGTIDSRTAKVHSQRRVGQNFRALGNIMHSCCEVGERLLKTEAKKISKTAQKRGSATFERQTCSRIIDRYLFEKMRLVIENESNNGNPNSPNKKDRFSRKVPHFILSRSDSKVWAYDRHGVRSNPDAISGNLHPLVVEKLLEELPEVDNIKVFNEVILRDGSYVRAFPNYRNETPWYDFVNVQWLDEDDGHPYILPAQCLAFYEHKEECMAVVQCVDRWSTGQVTGYRDTVLVSHYDMDCTRSGAPLLYTINCGTIDCCVIGLNHKPDSCILDRKRRSVLIVRPRNEWAYAWYVWNELLQRRNNPNAKTKPFVDLGTQEMVKTVRKMLHECIQEYNRTPDSP